jgi:hypothetical protein
MENIKIERERSILVEFLNELKEKDQKNIYIGEFKDGLKNGKGIYYFSNGYS